MSLRKYGLGLALLAPLCLTHCTREKAKVEQVDRAVWSDDNNQVAMIVQRFDQSSSSNPLSSTLRENLSHQIFIQDRNGGPRQAVGNEIQGQNARELYFMKRAGYLIASYLESDAAGGSQVVYYKMTLDGNVSRLTQQPHMRVLPSADGQYLALITQFPEQCTGSGAACPLDVLFRRAEDLSDVGTTHRLSFANGVLPELTWNLGGQLIASNGSESFALRPGQAEAVTVEHPKCVYPATSSSSIASSGDFVYPEQNQVAFRSTTAGEQPFGCQD